MVTLRVPVTRATTVVLLIRKELIRMGVLANAHNIHGANDPPRSWVRGSISGVIKAHAFGFFTGIFPA